MKKDLVLYSAASQGNLHLDLQFSMRSNYQDEPNIKNRLGFQMSVANATSPSQSVNPSERSVMYVNQNVSNLHKTLNSIINPGNMPQSEVK